MRINKTVIKSIWIPLIAIILGLLVGAVVMLLSGFNPIENYINLFTGAVGTPNAIGEVLRTATPLILTGAGFAVANSAGFFNIGVAGQALVGWLGSVSFALAFPDLPRILMLPGAIIAGALAGALWSGIAGVLRAYFGASEVITTIMQNYIALYATNAIIKGVLAKHNNDYSPTIPKAAQLRTPFLENLTQNSTLHWGLLIAIVAAIFLWWFMKKTTMGFEIRAVGMNQDASRYAGMSTKRTIIMAMLISGAFAGLGGAMEGLGDFQNIIVNTAMPDIGYDGMSVSLLAGGAPIGIIFSALLFGVLKIGGLNISIASTTPSEIVNIVIASVIFFVGAQYLIRYWMAKSKSGKKAAAKKAAEAAGVSAQAVTDEAKNSGTNDPDDKEGE
ncbi:ABC transporter permease [Lacticaseibacillus sharpeae]|uniref:Carbohydrate uptake ABC superfamily, ATP binding cassette transporter, membrane protein n=1 Tax=Lacticaseibacillus sharpeae JCM 1186 = DSM 20505 TaxID=1291052 RepID=A0A0R1ZM95_9LACO|nr:ABC transporter permease [Lacticaseibacillus sharpeae]KRM56176.1 carbohydrate uptake ABC superfamily, ATP binding cassette transporter, membrane protein [Lacticaseibacillus sharpeae JCM 1186 = DSM 20505]